MKDETLNQINDLLKNGRKVTPREAIEWAEKHHEEGLAFLVKIEEKHYKKWYENTPKIESLKDETLYMTWTDNKMFGNYGGYSCFGISCGECLRSLRIEKYFTTTDRIERLSWEWCVIPKD